MPGFEKVTCPFCGKAMSGATGLDDASASQAPKGLSVCLQAPKEGDFAVCLYCGGLLRFVGSGLVGVTEEEARLDLPTEVLAVLLRARGYIMARHMKPGTA